MKTQTLHVGPFTTSTAHRLLHYDGVCSNVHGHNMEWEVELSVEFVEDGQENMTVDFKEVSDMIDRYDHAILLNGEDPLCDVGALGDIYRFGGDPTCELVAEVVAGNIVDEFDRVHAAKVKLAETDKYAIGTSYSDAE